MHPVCFLPSHFMKRITILFMHPVCFLPSHFMKRVTILFMHPVCFLPSHFMKRVTILFSLFQNNFLKSGFPIKTFYVITICFPNYDTSQDNSNLRLRCCCLIRFAPPPPPAIIYTASHHTDFTTPLFLLSISSNDLL